MARVTVEDCVEKVPNRFDLVMFAAQRARDISSGAQETVSRDNDKDPVIALREIAIESVDNDVLQDTLIQGLQKVQPADDLDDDDEVVTALQADSSVLGVGHPTDPQAAANATFAAPSAQPQGETEGEGDDAGGSDDDSADDAGDDDPEAA